MNKLQKILLSIIVLILACLYTYRKSSEEDMKNLKYYQLDTSAEPFRIEIILAFDEWTKHTGIQFKEMYVPYRTIRIYRDSLENHPYLKDGTVGVYHIDTKKLYVFRDYLFEDIFLHEVGHAIGISHNTDIKDVMYPSMESEHNITKTSLQSLLISRENGNYLLFY